MLPIDTAQLSFWTVGFLFTLYTGTAGWAYGVVALAWFTIVHPAIYREAADPVQVDFHYWWVFSTTAGVVTAAVMQFSFRLGKLLKTELVTRQDGGANTKSKHRFLSLDFSLFVVWAGTLFAGYYCLRGDFSDGLSTWPYARAMTTGVVLIVGGALAAVLHFSWMFANSSGNRRSSSLNAKYIIALAAGLASVPVAYDVSIGHVSSTVRGLIALAVTIGYWGFTFMWLFFFWWNENSQSMTLANTGRIALMTEGTNKYWVFGSQKQDRFRTVRQLVVFIVGGFAAQFVLYLVAWLVDSFYHPLDSALPVVVAIGATSAFECLVFILVGSWITVWDPKPKRI